MAIWKLLDKLFGKQKVKTQTMVYKTGNSSNDTCIHVTFKRAGNIVECYIWATISKNTNGLLTSTQFTGEVPNWAYPDVNFSKKVQNTSSLTNNDVSTYLSITLRKTGGFTLLYGNLDTGNDKSTAVLNFTYIVDDNDKEYQQGDVDGNGEINEIDLIMIQDYIMFENPLSDKQFKAADVNKDGQVKATDWQNLKNKLGI